MHRNAWAVCGLSYLAFGWSCDAIASRLLAAYWPLPPALTTPRQPISTLGRRLVGFPNGTVVIGVSLRWATGSANAVFGWYTPWNLDCCFGVDDGQHMAIPTALVHYIVAIFIAVAAIGWSLRAMRAIGDAAGLAPSAFSGVVWTMWTIGRWSDSQG